jgi:hypothetical protein
MTTTMVMKTDKLVLEGLVGLQSKDVTPHPER